MADAGPPSRGLAGSDLVGLVATRVGPLAAAPDHESGAERNPQAVREVLSVKRTEVSAAWWVLEEDDSTEAVQAAIESGEAGRRVRHEACLDRPPHPTRR